MLVNSSTAYTPQSSSSLSVDTQLRANQQGEQLIVRERSEAREQQNAQAQESQQRQQRFDVSEQAITEFEQQSQALQSQEQQTSLQAKPEQNSQSANQQSAEYDQPNGRNQTAISAYQNVDYIPQREAIKQSFGVDLYA